MEERLFDADDFSLFKNALKLVGRKSDFMQSALAVAHVGASITTLGLPLMVLDLRWRQFLASHSVSTKFA